jgi:hypothetical protein
MEALLDVCVAQLSMFCQELNAGSKSTGLDFSTHFELAICSQGDASPTGNATWDATETWGSL